MLVNMPVPWILWEYFPLSHFLHTVRIHLAPITEIAEMSWGTQIDAGESEMTYLVRMP